MSLFMKGDWLPLMCFIGAILSKVCETKFSNASYVILLPVLKYVMRLSLYFSLSKHYQNLWLLLFEACFKNGNHHFMKVR